MFRVTTGSVVELGVCLRTTVMRVIRKERGEPGRHVTHVWRSDNSLRNLFTLTQGFVSESQHLLMWSEVTQASCGDLLSGLTTCCKSKPAFLLSFTKTPFLGLYLDMHLKVSYSQANGGCRYKNEKCNGGRYNFGAWNHSGIHRGGNTWLTALHYFTEILLKLNICTLTYISKNFLF